MSRFQSERNYFASFKANVPDDAVSEYEKAISALHKLYNTTIYENRFIVGGAVEVFTTLLLRSAGIPADRYGDETVAGDIILPDNRMLSVKGSFTGKRNNIRLINLMESEKKSHAMPKWRTATLFVLAGVGIVYGDPDMLQNGDLVRQNDALSLRRKAVDRFAEDVANYKQISIAPKQPKQMTGFSHKASTTIAREILTEQRLNVLLGQVKGF